jgi:hypothetical protein
MEDEPETENTVAEVDLIHSYTYVNFQLPIM